MSPIDDLQSRDLEWIQEFIMQQIVMMLRPMMEHLQQTDATVDYSQQAIQRVGMDVAEVRDDLARTSKYLAVLRQGLGIQNEGKVQMQINLDNTMRSVKRIEENMENVLGIVQGTEDNVAMLSDGVRGTAAKAEELEKQVTRSNHNIEELRVSLDRAANDARLAKDSLANNEARLEMLQREFRRTHLQGAVVNLDQKAGKLPSQGAKTIPAVPGADAWPQKHRFGSPADGSGSSGGLEGRRSLVRNNSRGALQQDIEQCVVGGPALSKPCSRQASSEKPGLFVSDETQALPSGAFADAPGTPLSKEASGTARLPMLVKPPGAARLPDNAYAAGPRLRFTQTMTSPPSRDTPRGSGPKSEPQNGQASR